MHEGRRADPGLPLLDARRRRVPVEAGLYGYDFIEDRILDTDGFGRPSGRIYAHLVTAFRSGDKARIADAFVHAFEPG